MIWALTMEGVSSHHKDIVYFKLVSSTPPPAATPGGGPPACDPNGTQNASVAPLSGPVGTVFHITVRGFQPGENAGYWLTDPDGAVYGTRNQLTIPPSGGGTLSIDSYYLYTGRWALTVEGVSSHNVAIAYFCITP